MGKPTFDLCYSEIILRTCGIVSGLPERPRGGFGLAEINMEVFAPEYIGLQKRTRGTETSKYPEERTSTRLR
jgi:hypothetical protein